MRAMIRVGLGLALGAAAVSPMHARADETLNVGVVGTTSDAPFFIADQKGYFAAEGLKVHFTQFDSAAKMIAPLGTGELDVGGGATSAALYNARGRGVNVKIVADKAKNSAGYGFQAMMVRKALQGKVRSFADLKGLKVAVSAAGNSESFLLQQALKKDGLTLKDVDVTYLGFPQHAAAFANGAIDASISTEPTTTLEIRKNVAFKLAGVDTFYPNFQTAVTLYGGDFIKNKPDEAKRFMKALIRAFRFYRANLVNGHLSGPQADEIIAIDIKEGQLKDPEIYRELVSNDIDPDGKVDEASLRAVWGFFKEQGLINGKVTVDDVLDMSFAKAAAAELGPAKGPEKR